MTQSTTQPVTRIIKSSNIATQINTLSVKPENQAELLKHMSAQASEVMAQMSGFVSINLHRSLDGTRVTNYAQWQTAQGLEEAHNDPDFVAHLKGYRDMVLKAGPRIYTILQTLGGDAEDPIALQKDGGGVTLINVLETKPEQQANLVEVCLEGFSSLSEQPGLHTATLLRSHDATQVVSYEQWDQEAYETATNTPESAYAAHLKQITEIASSDPHLFEIAFTIHADNYDALIG